MKYLNYLSLLRHILRTKKVLLAGLLALSLLLGPLIPFFSFHNSSKQETPKYFASELTMRSKKTLFTPVEKPTFKIGIGKPVTQDGKVLEKISGTNVFISEVHAQETSLPELQIKASRTIRETDIVQMVANRTAPDEIEIKVADAVSFRPGKYRMSITSGNRNIEQDFTWGVLAVNTNKSVYSPGETAKIGMAVLDDIGRTKCMTGAYAEFNKGKVWLTITDPLGKKTEHSSENGLVIGSPECEEHSVTNEADFQTTYKTTTPGIYQIDLIGENQNGKKSIADYFEVKSDQSVIVERISLPTRIFPASDYSASISVTTKGPFKGQIIETTPASFIITCDGCQVLGENSLNDASEPADRKATHTIVWDVDWKTGGSHTLSYTINPPNVSPEFFLLGPLTLSQGKNILFKEVRQWQIASDALITWNGNGASVNWSVAGNWSTGAAPTTAANVVLDGVASPNGNANSTINNATVGAVTDITINGYTGTVTQGAAIATSGTSGITVTSGTLTGATQAITLTDGSLTVNGGVFTTTTGAVSIQLNLTFSSGTLTNNASGINFTDNTSADDSTLSCSSTLSGTWRINKTSGGDFALGSGCTVSMSENVTSSVGLLTNDGTLTITGASTVLNIVDNNIDNNSSLTVDSSGARVTVERNFDNTGGTLTNNGTIDFPDSTNADDSTLTCGNTPGGTFRINKAQGSDFTLSSSCTITATENVTSSLGRLTNNGTLTLDNGTFVFGQTDTTLSVDNNSSLTLDTDAIITLQRNFDSTGGSITNNGNINWISDEAGATDSPDLTCNSSLGGSGSYNLNFAAAADFTLSSSCTVTMSESLAGVAPMGLLTNNGVLTLAGSGASFDFNSTSPTLLLDNNNTLSLGSGATITIQRNFDNTGGSFSNSGTVIFDADEATDDSTFTCGNTPGGTFRIDKTLASDFTLSSGCTISASENVTSSLEVLTNNGNLTLTGTSSFVFTTTSTNLQIDNNGTMTIDSSVTVSLHRNFDNTGGTLTNSGTVVFNSDEATDDSTFTCGNTPGGTFRIDKTTGGTTFTLSSGCTASFTESATVAMEQITNNGTMTLTGGSSSWPLTTTSVTDQVVNTGTLNITGGAALSLHRSFNDTGTVSNSGGSISFLSDEATVDDTTLTCGGSSDFGDVTINKTSSGSTFTISSNCVFNDFIYTSSSAEFSNPGSARTLSVTGNFTMDDIQNLGGANLTVEFSSTGTQTINKSSTGLFQSKFSVNKTAGGNSVGLATALTVTTETCNIVEGTFETNGFTFTCAGGFTVQDGGNLQMHGSETPTSPTLNSGSTVTYEGNGDGVADTRTMKAYVYHHLTVNSSVGTADTFQPPNAFTGANDINGNLTITDGTFDVISGTNYGVDVVGSFSIATDGIFLAQAGTLKIGDDFTNNGTFTAGTGTVELNTATTATLNGSGSPAVTFNNFTVTTAAKTVQFTASKTFRINGLLTITGTAGNEVVINSTSGTQWLINHQGTENVTYANVTNSGCDGTSTTITIDATSINNGNNGTCWDFPILNITVSGNIYSDEGSSAYDCSANNITVYTSVNGAANDTPGTCTLNTGAFSITATKPTAAAQPIVIFIDSGESIKATTVTLTADATSNITGLKLYVDHLVLTHEDSGPMTNAKLATGDNADAGIRYSVASSNLTVESGIELFVYNSKTFTPGGTVTTQGSLGDFQLGTSATATLGTATNTISNDILIGTSATLNVNTDTIVAGGDITATGTLNTTSGTPTITMRGTGSISGAGSKTVYTLLIGDGTTATTTLSGTLTANNDVTVGTGSTFNQNASLNISGGDFTTTTTGIVNTTSGTGTVTITGTGNVGAGSGGSFTVYNLAANGTQTLISDIVTTNNISIATGGSLALASKNVTVSGGTVSTAGTGAITCSACSAGTVTISGTGNIGGGGTVTVYNLQINGTQTLASALTVSNDAVVGTGGILDLGSQNMTVTGGDFTNTTTGIIRCNSCSAGTLTMPATGNLGSGSGDITLYNLATSGTGTTTFSGSGTNTVSNNVTVGAGTTLAINSSISITGSFANTTTGIITTTSGNPTVTVSGATIGGGSGAITFYDLTKAGGGTTTFSGAGTNTVNNNLSISNGTFTQSDSLTVTNDISVATGATYNNNATLAVNGGDFTTTSTGVINTTSGTPTLTISGTGSLGGGNGNITLYNLTTTGSGTTTFSGGGTNTINNNVSVGAGTTLNINSTIGITGNLTNTSTGIIGTTSGTPTVTVSGTTIGGGSGAITIYTLAKATASTTTFSGGGTNTLSQNLTVSAGTLTISNDLSIGNDVSVATSSTLNLNGNTSIGGGDATTAGTGIISTTSGTPTLSVSGTGTVGGGGAVSAYNLTISGSQTISSATTVSNDLNINGTMSGSSTVTVNGNLVGIGAVSHGGTVEHRIGSDKNFGATSGSGTWAFTTLKFTNSSGSTKTITTQTGGAGGVSAATVLQVGETDDSAGINLDAGNKTWTLSGTSGAPLSIEDGSIAAATSTFVFSGNNGGGNTTINDITYYRLTVNNGSETFVLAASPLLVTNTLTISAGTLSVSTNSVTVGSSSVSNSGSILNSGTYSQSAGGTTTVKSSAGGSSTIGGSGTTTFYNLSIAPDAASAPTITLGSAGSQTITVSNNLGIGDGSNSVIVTANTNNPALDVNGNFTINTSATFTAPPSASFTIAGNMTNDGTFTHNNGTVTLDTTTTATLTGSGSTAITFYNLTSTTATKTILFTSTKTFKTDGLVTLTGSSGNNITVDATSNGSQWLINHQGTENITYTSVQDSGCDGASTTITLGTTNTNNGNNSSCWVFTMDVTGNVYTDEGSSAYDCSSDNLTIHISVNGAASTTTTCTLNTGAFSFSGVTKPSNGTPIVLYIDSGETPKATTVTLADSSLTGVKIYQNHVNLTHENAGPITNTNLSTADNGDSGIRYNVSSGNVTFDTDMEAHVLGSKTYTPGGNVTTQGSAGDFHLASSSTATLGGITTLSGDVQVDTGATLTINADTAVSGGAVATSGTGSVTTSSGTPTLTISGTGNIGGGGSVTAYNLTVSGTQTLQSNLIANNDISVSNGASLALNGKDTTVTGGDFTTTGTGAITCSGCSAGTTTINGGAASGLGGGGAVTVYNLTIGGTVPLLSTLTALNTLTVNGTFSGSSNATVNGSIAGTGTIIFSGGTVDQRVGASQNFGTTSGSTNWTFSTLIFSNSSGTSKTVTTQTGGSGTVTASTLLQIGKGGDSAATVLDAGNRNWIVQGTSGTPLTLPQGSVTANTSTVSYTGNNTGGNTTIATITYYSLLVNNSSETYTPSTTLAIDNGLTVTSGTLDLGTNDTTIGSTGVSNSGGVSVLGTLTQSSSATTTIRTSASGASTVGGSGSITFYNLSLAPAANSGVITLGSATSQTITVSGTLTIGNGSNSVTVTANTNNPTIDVNGSLTINTSGTLVAPPSSILSIAANMTNDGTFTANGGTVRIDGSGTSVLNGSSSPAIIFANFLSSTAGKTIQFTASKIFRITGSLTITGATGNTIAIQSTSGTQWLIDHQGTESVTNATITNSGCDGASTDITLGFSNFNGGNNGVCWVFTAGGAIQSRVKGTTRVGGNARIQ